MMGLSLVSALTIQGNETLISVYQNNNSGKYGYAITHNEEKYCRPIVSSESLYNSKDEALTAGEELLDEIKALDLTPQREALVFVLGKETAETIDSVVLASKK